MSIKKTSGLISKSYFLIQNIFKKRGEVYFRKFEEKITLQEIKREGIVISLGGGAFINPKITGNNSTKSTYWIT